MLSIISGRAASGKTEYLLNKLAAAVHKGEKAYLVVPRQYTFESDREKLRHLGNETGNKITVLSFDRIYELLTREYGRPVGERLTDSGARLLMIIALRECKKELRLFKNQTENESFINAMISFCKNLKRQNQTPQDIDAVAYAMENCTLKAKLSEFALIAAAFDRLVGERFVNPDDDLTRTVEFLSRHKIFQNAAVGFDGFSDFSQAEFAVVSEILQTADDVSVTLCCDNVYADDPCSKFSESAECARRLMSECKKLGKDIAKPVYLEGGKSFLSDELRFLEAGFLNEDKRISNEPTHDIVLCEAGDIYDECDKIAETIHRLVREQGYRYGNITVIARDIAEYGGVLYSTFKNYGIPVFYDARRPLLTQPLTRTLLAILSLASGGFSSDDIFTYLKCGLSPFEDSEVEECEKYVFIWDIDGFDNWNTPWQGNVHGFDGRNTENEIKALDALNDFRQRLISHIKEPFFELKKCSTARDMSEKLFYFIEKSGLKARLAQYYESEKQIDPQNAALIPQVYDKLIELLGLMGDTFAEREITLSEYQRCFKTLCKTTALATIPQSSDEVQVGEAGKIRPVDPEVVFVLGANYQKFPLEVSDGELFSMREKITLEELGIPQGLTPLQSMSKEYFIAYTALAAPKKLLFVSFKSEDQSGAKLTPSIIADELKAIFPKLKTVNCKDRKLSDIESPYAARCEFAAIAQKDKSAAETLRLALGEESDRLLLMNGGLKAQLSAETAKKLYKGNMSLSPSRVEKFFHCPFSYFCSSGLHISPVEKAKIDNRQRGSLIHYLLEMILKNEDAAQLLAMSNDERMKVINHYFDLYSEDLNVQISRSDSFKWSMERIKKDAEKMVLFILEELAQSDFHPVGFEVNISKDGDVAPTRLTLADGSELYITGQADRVDVAEINGRRYLRVIDYKTGSKDFYLNDVYYGLNMQMLIYLFSLTENGSGEMKNSVPAGILYLSAKSDSTKYNAGDQKKNDMKMKGIILDDPSVILGMDRTGGGKYISQKLKKDGTPDKRSLVSSHYGFDLLRERIYEKLREMGDRVKSGDVGVTPLDGSEKTACRYCDFQNVCRIESGVEPQKVSKGNDLLLDELKSEQSANT